VSSYSQKLLRATLILPAGTFPGTSSNTLTLAGYRMLASIKAAGCYANTLTLAIYGMRQADMNAVTILWGAATFVAMNARALVQLEASGDGGASWCQVFEGRFVEASPDYTNVPNAMLHVLAQTGYGAQIDIAPPTSYRGSISIAAVAAFIAGEMGFALENNGVTGNISTPYYPGTYMDQFRELCRHANLDFYFDGNATLAICPKNQPRQGKGVPVFSPTMGNLVGVPTVQRFGVHAEVIFTPALTIGAELQIQGSIVPSANGTWFAGAMTHDLESLQPDGAWFSRIDCYPSSAQAALAAAG
jgi:hypothetical protein